MGWLCDNCGPVRNFMPGNRGEPRCTSDGCDLELKYERIKAPAPAKPKDPADPGPSYATIAQPKKPSSMSPEHLREQARQTREGKAILERVREREKALASGRVGATAAPAPRRQPPRPLETDEPEDDHEEQDTAPDAPDEETTTEEESMPRDKKSRTGKCEECGETKWLLSKSPDYCKGCFHKKNQLPSRALSDPGALAAPKQRRPRKKKEEEPDALAREVRATEAVARELSGLPPGSVRRVLRFALDHVAEATRTNPRLLLGLDAGAEPPAS